MFRVSIMALAALAILTPAVFADIAGPPLPSHLKQIDPPVQFHGLEDYPEHVFFLRYYSSRGNPHGARPRLVELKNSDAITLQPYPTYRFALLAMPRADFARSQAEDPSLAWLAGKPLNAKGWPLDEVYRDELWATRYPEIRFFALPRPPAFASAYVSEPPVTEYRVAFHNGRVTVEVVAMDEPNWTPPWQRLHVVGGAILGAAAVVGLGLWLARRRRNKLTALAQINVQPGKTESLPSLPNEAS